MAADTIERTYNIPVRRAFQKVPRWRKTKKAVTAAKEFLAKHMKSSDIRLDKAVNEEMWKHGGKNPPHHIKVFAVKDKEGVVRASLVDAKKSSSKKSDSKKVEKKAVKAKPAKVEEKKVEAKVAVETKAPETPSPAAKAE